MAKEDPSHDATDRRGYCVMLLFPLWWRCGEMSITVSAGLEVSAAGHPVTMLMREPFIQGLSTTNALSHVIL